MTNARGSRMVSLAAGAMASVMMPLVAMAQEHEAADKQGAIASVKQGVYTAGTALVVFMIVFVVLATKVWPVITKGLDERAKKIRDEIESAEMARQQAKEALEQYQASLSQARVEAQKEIDKARAQATAIAAELKAKADVELAQAREKAMRDIENAKRAAVAEIYADSANLASIMAGKILRREVSVGDRQRLVEESLAQLGKN